MAKKALITGANKGIGFETARQLGKRGYFILLGARNEERGTASVAQLRSEGVQAEWLRIDLNDLSTIEAAGQYVATHHADMNLLINNAGIPGDMSKRPLDFQLSELKAVTEVNFYGNFEMIKEFTPILAKNRGRVANITIPTMYNRFFHPFAYMASKAPLNVMIHSIGGDFKANKVPVEIFGIMPGGVTTDLNDHMTGWIMRTLPEASKDIVDVVTDHKNHQGKILNRSAMVTQGVRHVLRIGRRHQ